MNLGQAKMGYLMGNQVELSKKLAHGDRLWVQCHEDDFLLFAEAFIVQQSQCVGKNVQHFCLPGERLSDQHESESKQSIFFYIQYF